MPCKKRGMLMNRRSLFYTTLTSASLIILTGSQFIKSDPHLLYNPSESARVGWYRIEKSSSLSVGDEVVAYLPEEARELADARNYLPRDIPVIKTIGGGAGEQYCIHDGQLQIEDRHPLSILPFDSQGRAMPELPDGCVEISDGHVLLISEQTYQSFDSRYFGQVDLQDVVGTVRYLGSIEAN